MADMPRKLRLGRWLARVIFGASMVALLLMYGSSRNVTVSELTKVIASTNVFLVAGVEILDKISDRSTYARMYGFVYQKWAGQRRNDLAGILSPILVSAFVFLSVLYLVAGNLSFTLGSYSPAVLLWSGTLATYVMLPETGDDELIAWIWLGATIATHGQYLPNAFAIPALTRLIGMILRL